MKIPVVWWTPPVRGCWNCVHMLNEMFDLYECRHLGRTNEGHGEIIVVHGGNEQLHGQGPAVAEEINEFAKPLEWCIFVNIGDEQSEFCVEQLSHPNSRLWLQTPLPSQKADRYLIEGYPARTQNLQLTRDLDWFFAGQVNHVRRQQCIDALARTRFGHFCLFPTDGFGKGLPHDDYICYMNRAKIVPCPSGPATPDSFRMAEALECGAIPILDARSLNNATAGFWDVVLPNHPLPVIDDWSTLPGVMEGILGDYERISRLVAHWWKGYKLEFRTWLAKDLVKLGAQ
jgi:hypothetical protein